MKSIIYFMNSWRKKLSKCTSRRLWNLLCQEDNLGICYVNKKDNLTLKHNSIYEGGTRGTYISKNAVNFFSPPPPPPPSLASCWCMAGVNPSQNVKTKYVCEFILIDHIRQTQALKWSKIIFHAKMLSSAQSTLIYCK